MEIRDFDSIKKLCIDTFDRQCDTITQLPVAGSSRRYYRVSIDGEKGVIATVGTSAKENNAFLALSKHFVQQGFNVPQVLAVSEDGMVYLQTDLGDKSLFDMLSQARASGCWRPEDIGLLEDIAEKLAGLQFDDVDNIDFSKCYPSAAMDRRSVMWDLNYFKYCFLKAELPEIDEVRLEEDFSTLVSLILSEEVPCGFMYRDFQSRNVMMHDDRPWFIDFQGGRRGPCLYDIVSFLWQARAGYPEYVRNKVIAVYFDTLQKKIDVSKEKISKHLPDFILFRTLQVLGAYGFRGYFERKPHFIASITPALANLVELLDNNDFSHLPYLNEVMREVIERKKVTNPNTERTTLRVKVSSFSYRVGYPDDNSGNGGGFVFDCRAITNPGRFDEYKFLTGLDRPVIEFIESGDEMKSFLDNAYALVSASVQKYLSRGFTDLSVAFGCTGGRHRSVYAAQHMAERLNGELGVEVEICHREREIHSLLPAR